MKRFEINRKHIKERLEDRYKNCAGRADEIINKVETILEKNTPHDWRFTESPSSRFFIIEEETGAKFMGMSYRSGAESHKIIREIQKNVNNLKILFHNLNSYVDSYIVEVLNPNLPLAHEIRTVYPRKKGDMAEEKRLFETTRTAVTHIIPLASRKIASRPNAIVDTHNTLWVRQYMNWVSMKPGSKEYYLFHPLTKEGLIRNRCALFSYSENGDVKKLPEHQIKGQFPAICALKADIVSQAQNENMKIEPDIRSESYWRVPTYLDRRLIDLDFKERYSSLSDKGLSESEKISSSELVELYFLRRIVERVQQKLYKT
jgi:hypothetical protein